MKCSNLIKTSKTIETRVMKKLYTLEKFPLGMPRGWEASLRKSVVQSSQYDVTSRVTDFQNGEQSVHRGDRQKFRFYHGNTVPISWIWRF